MDEPVAKGLAEDVEGDQTRLLHVLTGGGSSRGLWRRVEEARREEQVVVAQLAVLDRDDERRLVRFLLEIRLGGRGGQPRDERLAVVASGDVRRWSSSQSDGCYGMIACSLHLKTFCNFLLSAV